ncbi:unnamed protein product [Rhodiola kirilowii]
MHEWWRQMLGMVLGLWVGGRGRWMNSGGGVCSVPSPGWSPGCPVRVLVWCWMREWCRLMQGMALDWWIDRLGRWMNSRRLVGSLLIVVVWVVLMVVVSVFASWIPSSLMGCPG